MENSYIPFATFPLSVGNLEQSKFNYFKKSAISPSSRATAAIPRCWRPVSRRSCCRWRQTASLLRVQSISYAQNRAIVDSQRSTRTPVSTM